MKRQLAYIRRNLTYISPWKWKAGAKAVFRRLSRSGVFLSESELGMCSLHPVRKVDRIVELVNARSILDIGCGTGKTTVYLHRRGFEAVGVEASSLAILKSENPDLIHQHDLRNELHLRKSFDLVWCFEVAEHIHPKFVDIFVNNLTRHWQR
jgi:2-polyprenyl-3-methyl-5-hydroxy-6-metoxy-1,4-benzoquinol methylase